MPAITSPRSYAIPADESPDPMFWQYMADDTASEARLAYIDGDYEYAVRTQRRAARYAATARKEYQRWIAQR
jgi:hypothetical protein